MQYGLAIYFVLGLEVQALVHYAMPVRGMFYDALSYARQVTEATASYRKERNGATLADTDAAMPRISYIMHLSASRHKACASLQSLAVIRHDNRQFLFLWWAAGYSWQCVEWKSAEGVSAV